MTSKQKIKKALSLIKEVLLEGNITDDNNLLQQAINHLEDVLKINN